ncbi:hypothetical protein IL38_21065 [Actinopolyspora erythraea]|uniref:Type II toxin-antitoxin system PemK/MazF family toxin n=1 Tax=Actinopolyspora erythraea TaxID=414996 RepID=A0ABR4WZ79_9ACTN|nr:type II toxin-antitoxin system PemK/MazF family toxin [Actinopolyspora erythraea]KGI79704.1 hypothetical protein IL38_21065 [Actinopolyspora erythraea]
MTAQPIRPGDVWILDSDPTRDDERDDEGSDERPVLVVSSRSHLELTNSALASVLSLTSVERSDCPHRVHVSAADSWVITEQVRTVAARRFRRFAPELAPTDEELADVRRALADMLIV